MSNETNRNEATAITSQTVTYETNARFEVFTVTKQPGTNQALE